MALNETTTCEEGGSFSGFTNFLFLGVGTN